jgi:hypothetical protein
LLPYRGSTDALLYVAVAACARCPVGGALAALFHTCVTYHLASSFTLRQRSYSGGVVVVVVIFNGRRS